MNALSRLCRKEAKKWFASGRKLTKEKPLGIKLILNKGQEVEVLGDSEQVDKALKIIGVKGPFQFSGFEKHSLEWWLSQETPE